MSNQFRFVITDLFSGTIKGTNNAKKAYAYAQCDEWFVYDTQNFVQVFYDADNAFVAAPIEEIEDIML